MSDTYIGWDTLEEKIEGKRGRVRQRRSNMGQLKEIAGDTLHQEVEKTVLRGINGRYSSNKSDC